MSINDDSISYYFLGERNYLVDILCLFAFVSPCFKTLVHFPGTRRHKGTKTRRKNQCMIITKKGFADMLPNLLKVHNHIQSTTFNVMVLKNNRFRLNIII